MKKFISGASAACILSCGIAGSADAALTSSLGGLAVYDDDLDITWVSNANLAKTNAFGVAGINADGTMNWATANNWIAAMNASTYLGFSNWRLPGTLVPDDVSCTSDAAGTTPSGDSTGFNCNGSEMGHLFYSELNATADTRVTQTGDTMGLALFSNIMDDETIQPPTPPTSSYFSSTEFNTTQAWRFRFGTGSQFAVDKNFDLYAWAVHDGNIGAVPVPGAVWLFGSGLLGLVAMARRKRT